MITFIAFIVTMIGSINWLSIGFLQYDFIAGLFGFQASIFSRIFYILFGVASVYLGIRVIVNKGTFKVFERKKKKKDESNAQQPAQPAYAAVSKSEQNFSSQQTQEQRQDSLFDEHMNNF